MDIELPTQGGRLIKRYKRFLADIELDDGEMITAHCPNTGSLLGCKDPGSRVVVRDSQDPKRKLRYSFQAIEVDGTLVNVDTGFPNQVVFEAIQDKKVPSLRGYASARREVKYGTNSRIDVLLEDPRKGLCYVEVKNTTWAQGKLALFPDAVTERGLKHLGELEKVVAQGHRAVQFFFISRCDVTRFAPADEVDPAYGAGLRRAAEAGVEILAYSAEVTPTSLELGRKLRVSLDPRID